MNTGNVTDCLFYNVVTFKVLWILIRTSTMQLLVYNWYHSTFSVQITVNPLFTTFSHIKRFQDLELKGQMVFCPESDSVLFIGSPFLDGLEGLTGSGLFISDIPLHDATRDVILVGEQARAQVYLDDIFIVFRRLIRTFVGLDPLNRGGFR